VSALTLAREKIISKLVDEYRFLVLCSCAFTVENAVKRKKKELKK
jgi:hypothetical protein